MKTNCFSGPKQLSESVFFSFNRSGVCVLSFNWSDVIYGPGGGSEAAAAFLGSKGKVGVLLRKLGSPAPSEKTTVEEAHSGVLLQ